MPDGGGPEASVGAAEPGAEDVGGRLKALRVSRGLSQRQLASIAGVTNSLISTIEKNAASPSVASLKKILDGLSMSLSDFFAGPAPNGDGIVFRAADLKEINPGRVFRGASHAALKALSLRQVGPSGRHSIQMLHETYEPGADTGDTLYTHESEEAGIVISGEIEITVEDTVHVLKAGDAYIFDSRRPHRFRNSGDGVCVIVSACTPPSF